MSSFPRGKRFAQLGVILLDARGELGTALLLTAVSFAGCYESHEAAAPCTDGALPFPVGRACDVELHELAVFPLGGGSGARIAPGEDSLLLIWRDGSILDSPPGPTRLATSVMPVHGRPSEPQYFLEDVGYVREPDAVWTGSGWLGTWTERGPPTLARIDPMGTPHVTGRVEGGPPGSELRSQLLVVDEHYALLVWIVVTSEGTAVFASEVDIDSGEPRGEPIRLPLDYGWPHLGRQSTAGPPWILFVMDGAILGQTLSPSGSPLAPPRVLVARAATETLGPFAHAEREDGGMLAYTREGDDGAQRVALRLLDTSGNPIGDAPPLHSDCESSAAPSLVAYRDGYAMAFRHTGSDGTTQRLVTLDARGRSLTQQQLPQAVQLTTDASGELHFSAGMATDTETTLFAGHISCP